MERNRPAITLITKAGDVARYPDLDSIPPRDHSMQLAAIPWGFRPWEHLNLRGLAPVAVPFFEESVWLATANGSIEVFDPPRQSLSAKSNAIYIGRSSDKSEGWLLQVLPPHGRTSRHFHTRKRERFIHLAGSVSLGHHVAYRYEEDPSVDPGVHHHLRAGAEASLTLLIIQWVDPAQENGMNPLCMEDHHYEPDPLWF